MLVIAGTFDIDPDQHDLFAEAARKIMAATRQEEGCLLYAFTADLEDPGRIHVVEKWTTQEALTAHLTLPHVAEFVSVVRPHMRGSEVLKYEVASEGPVR